MSKGDFFGRIRLTRERDAWVLCVSQHRSSLIQGLSALVQLETPGYTLVTKVKQRRSKGEMNNEVGSSDGNRGMVY